MIKSIKFPGLALIVNCAVSCLAMAEVAVTPKAWNHESEASIVLVGGNSRTESYSAKQVTGYSFGLSKFVLSGHYLLGKANSVNSAENWNAALRYERSLSARLALFTGLGVSSDRFAGIASQFDYDLGVKFTWWKAGEKDYYFSEAGYRYTYYDYVGGTIPKIKRSHIVRVYNEVAKSINDKVFARLWVELLPDIGDIRRKWVVNFEPSLNVGLSQYLSLKTGFLGKYDSRPANAALKKFDYTYTLALIAKY